MRILLVEDNRVLGEALRDHLEAMGHDTEWRKGLIESVSATMAYTFDMILLDLRLPDGNGLTLLRHVANSEAIRPLIPK